MTLVEELDVDVGPGRLPGTLHHDAADIGLVVFVHGSGSSRHSPRNRAVAATLRQRRIATLLFDLLDEDEALDRERVFDITLLAERILGALTWLESREDVGTLPVGLFGASTGAAAAFVVAARRPSPVAAIVSRGGRVDLAIPWAPQVLAPTLLIVGGADRAVLRLNRLVLPLLAGPKRLEVVPGASHLFEEPGTLEAVATMAGEWFATHLPARRSIP